MAGLVKSNKGVSSEICSLFSWEASAGSRTLGLMDGADLCQHQQHPRRGKCCNSAQVQYNCSTAVVDEGIGCGLKMQVDETWRGDKEPEKEKWIAIGKL